MIGCGKQEAFYNTAATTLVKGHDQRVAKDEVKAYSSIRAGLQGRPGPVVNKAVLLFSGSI